MPPLQGKSPLTMLPERHRIFAKRKEATDKESIRLRDFAGAHKAASD
jgi:hypothetical protein